MPTLPLQVSRLFEDDDDGVDGRMSELEAWADKVEGIWNDILQADSLAGKPRVSLPGFPIEVRLNRRGKNILAGMVLGRWVALMRADVA